MEKQNKDITFGYESALDRMHRIIKWLIVVIIILIVALVGTNLAWVIYENQFEEIVTTEENEIHALQLGEDNTVVGGDMNVNTGGQGQD